MPKQTELTIPASQLKRGDLFSHSRFGYVEVLEVAKGRVNATITYQRDASLDNDCGSCENGEHEECGLCNCCTPQTTYARLDEEVNVRRQVKTEEEKEAEREAIVLQHLRNYVKSDRIAKLIEKITECPADAMRYAADIVKAETERDLAERTLRAIERDEDPMTVNDAVEAGRQFAMDRMQSLIRGESVSTSDASNFQDRIRAEVYMEAATARFGFGPLPRF